MVELQPAKGSRWLSLGEARRLLDVSEATLRQWADSGYLRVYRTPGGHRRILHEDVTALTNGTATAVEPERENPLEGSALRRIRRHLNHENVVSQPWYQSIEEESRVRLRLFGRRLLSLLAQEIPAGRRRQEAMAEFLLLGHEYGSEMAARGVALKDTLQAFVFFRSMVLDSANPRSWTRILELADRVLFGVAEAYQERAA